MKIKSKLNIAQKGQSIALWLYIPPENAKKINPDKMYNIEIKAATEQRSLTANGYFWILTDKLAKKITIPKGDMYIKLVKRYGKFHQVIVKDEALTEFIKTWDHANTSVEHTDTLCEVTNHFRSKGVLYHELDCYEGTSDYNKQEFSKVLEGTISECELIGISTMTPSEVENLMKNYGGSNEN